MAGWETDRNGLLCRPPVHDGYVSAISYVTSAISITVDLPSKKTRLDIEGVEEANLNVWSGSIVAQIIISRVDEVANLGQDISTELWKTLFCGQAFEHDIDMLSRKVIARSPQSYLFVMFCSYGGPIACVAERIAASSLDNPA